MKVTMTGHRMGRDVTLVQGPSGVLASGAHARHPGTFPFMRNAQRAVRRHRSHGGAWPTRHSTVGAAEHAQRSTARLAQHCTADAALHGWRSGAAGAVEHDPAHGSPKARMTTPSTTLCTHDDAGPRCRGSRHLDAPWPGRRADEIVSSGWRVATPANPPVPRPDQPASGGRQARTPRRSQRRHRSSSRAVKVRRRWRGGLSRGPRPCTPSPHSTPDRTSSPTAHNWAPPTAARSAGSPC